MINENSVPEGATHATVVIKETTHTLPLDLAKTLVASSTPDGTRVTIDQVNDLQRRKIEFNIHDGKLFTSEPNILGYVKQSATEQERKAIQSAKAAATRSPSLTTPAPTAKQSPAPNISKFMNEDVIESAKPSGNYIGVNVNGHPITNSAMSAAQKIVEKPGELFKGLDISTYDLVQLNQAGVAVKADNLGRLTLDKMPEPSSYLSPAPRNPTKVPQSQRYSGGPNAIFGREQKGAGHGARHTTPPQPSAATLQALWDKGRVR